MRIIIASDFLMTLEAEQASNLRWMFDALRRPIEQGTGFCVSSFHDAGPKGSTEFSRSEFFRLSGLCLDPTMTQCWFDPSSISKASVDYLGQFIGPDDVILGYELSSETRLVLEGMSVRYVDMWLHPVRFMDDVLFAIGSSVPAVVRALEPYKVSRDLMQMYADRIKVQTYKGWYRKEADVLPGSALFVGQMRYDKSLCDNGRFLTLLDFKAEFEIIRREHSHVYYSRHPYMKAGDEDIIEYLQTLPDVTICDIPTYRLIASPRINTVCGISSSVLSEAEFFGKDVRYFFKPILDFSESSSKPYSAVQQDILNPKFWNNILSELGESIRSVNDVPDLQFLDKKDKVRDMLGFYWGYGQVDKVENMRIENAKIDQKPQAVATSDMRVGTVDEVVHVLITDQNHSDIHLAQKQIVRSKVVSFDIFDTLIDRALEAPSDLFNLIAPKAEQIVKDAHPEVIFDYVEARSEARKLACSAGHAFNEEVRLQDRYLAIGKKYGLSETVVSQLYQLEISTELKVCRSKWVGNLLYSVAKNLGKRVILTSDTFFDREVIEKLLSKAGYTDYDALYLSSETGVLKQTGNMFPVVLESEGVLASELVHIGDNKISDIVKAKNYGLSTIFVAEKSHASSSVSHLNSIWSALNNTREGSVIQGLAVCKHTQGMLSDDSSLTAGRADVLGYSVLGPMFLGFAQWILEDAQRRSIKDIYFLARDGKIVKECYDLIAPEDAPRSHYILASRRSSKMAEIATSGDVSSLLGARSSGCSLRQFLERRCSLKHIDDLAEIAAKCGIRDLDEYIDWSRNSSQLKSFLSNWVVVEAIKMNAEKEAQALAEYYKSQGLEAGQDGVAFVDIGHSGTIQRSICDLMGLEATHGYYFTTMADIEDVLEVSGHSSSGYYGNRIEADDAVNPYKKNLPMYEAVFLPPEASFVGIKDGRAQYVDVSLSPLEVNRRDLSTKLHSGVKQFVADYVAISDGLLFDRVLGPHEATSAFNHFLDSPEVKDAEIFSNIPFENTYSGRPASYLISPHRTDPVGSIWMKGAEVICDHRQSVRNAKIEAKCKSASKKVEKSVLREPSGVGHRLVSACVELFMPKRKVKKFRSNPYKFFKDSGSSALRIVGEAVYGGRYVK